MLNDLQQRCRWTGCNRLWPAWKGPASAGVCLSADPAHSCCALLQWLPVLLTSPRSPVYNRLVPTDTAVLPIKTGRCDSTKDVCNDIQRLIGEMECTFFALLTVAFLYQNISRSIREEWQDCQLDHTKKTLGCIEECSSTLHGQEFPWE